MARTFGIGYWDSPKSRLLLSSAMPTVPHTLVLVFVRLLVRTAVARSVLGSQKRVPTRMDLIEHRRLGLDPSLPPPVGWPAIIAKRNADSVANSRFTVYAARHGTAKTSTR